MGSQSNPDNLLAEIADRGLVRVGVLSADLPPLFFCADGEYAGLEASLVRLLVADVFGDIEIAWVPLSSSQRFDAVREGNVDFAVRITTITASRLELVDFTTPYLMDGLAIIAPIGKAVSDIAGLNGLRIALPQGTTTEAAVTAALEDAGVAFEPVPTAGPASEAVDFDLADAYGAAWTQGIFLPATEVTIISLGFTDRLAAFSSPSQPELAEAVDEAMREIIDSGVWETEFEAALGFAPPWTLDEMLGGG